jgi:hypothetical protein
MELEGHFADLFASTINLSFVAHLEMYLSYLNRPSLSQKLPWGQDIQTFGIAEGLARRY